MVKKSNYVYVYRALIYKVKAIYPSHKAMGLCPNENLIKNMIEKFLTKFQRKSFLQKWLVFSDLAIVINRRT